MVGVPELILRIADAGAPASDRYAAERQLCLELGPRIRLYGLRHLRDEAAAADLVQEALVALQLAARGGRIEEPEHVERFVFSTCRNLVARVRRAERRAQTFKNGVVPLSEAELPPAYTRVDAARLALCLGRVGPREQHVILLTFQEQRSVEEIATEMGTSPGNVRVLRHRALAALQRCVEGGAS